MSRNRYIVSRTSDIHGRGVYARRDIPAGTRIVQYTGEYVTYAVGNRRDKEREKKGKSVYSFVVSKDAVVDGGVGGGIARYINHSCSPNCYVTISGGKIWINALEDIRPGEEITYDYGFTYAYGKKHKCCCGSPNCVGVIVSKSERWKVKRNHKCG
jgi:SET domain-containing protein